MTPNTAQIMSILRWALSAGGPLCALLLARGQTPEQVTIFSTSLLTLVGALPPIISFVWGMFAHTDKAAIQTVAAMPDVAKIVATPGASDGVAAALKDPTMTKVVTQ